MNTSERMYLEEVGYWGLLPKQERECEFEYVDVGVISDEKSFG